MGIVLNRFECQTTIPNSSLKKFNDNTSSSSHDEHSNCRVIFGKMLFLLLIHEEHFPFVANMFVLQGLCRFFLCKKYGNCSVIGNWQNYMVATPICKSSIRPCCSFFPLITYTNVAKHSRRTWEQLIFTYYSGKKKY